MEPSARAVLSPLDVLLELMREKWADGERDAAAAIAKLAAPYVHPRASAAAPAMRVPLSQLNDDELGGWIDEVDPEDEIASDRDA